jgi:hypothetical protein
MKIYFLFFYLITGLINLAWGDSGKTSISPVDSIYINNAYPKFVDDILSANGWKVKSFGDYEHGESIDQDNRMFFGSELYSNYRFYNYHKELVELLNNKRFVKYAEMKREEYWKAYKIKSGKKKEIEKFQEKIGYSDILFPPSASWGSKELINVDSESGVKVFKSKYKNRFGITNDVYVLEPSAKPKGLIIAVHGRVSGPDNISGAKYKDYGNNFALEYAKAGFLVMAPRVDIDFGPNTYLLNLSSRSLDLSNLFDLLILAKQEKIKPIIVSGISYGAQLSERLAILSPDIDCLVSIGGEARGQFFDRILSGVAPPIDIDKKPPEYTQPDLSFLYSGDGIYYLVAPKKLIISIGLRDHDMYKLKLIERVNKFYILNGLKKSIHINIFEGGHEAHPQGEIEGINSVCLNKN